MALFLWHRSLTVLTRALVVAGFACIAAAAPGQTVPPPPPPDEWVYTVRPGDSLWTVSREHLNAIADWARLQSLNQIRDPLRLSPGTRLRIPFAWMKAQPAAARVIEAHGRVEIARGGQGGLLPLVAGAAIGPGDAVTTGADGSATFEFADGSRVLLSASGRLVFDVLSAYGSTGMVDTRLRLERGRTQVRVTPRRGRFRIWTPGAATVVRGTEFRAEFEDDAAVARTEVTTGTVETNAADTTVSVPEAFGTVAKDGAAPSPPTPLLPAPDIGAEPRLVRRLPVRLAVPPLPGAVAYHLEVAPDDRFQSLTFEGVSPRAEFVTTDLPDGTYAFRLRGVDVQGLHGLDAVSTLTLDARPEPPVLMAPAADVVLADERPTFSWTRSADATGYRFQLAREGALDAPIADGVHETGGPLTTGPSLGAGRYAWRVATRAAADEGPFSDWQVFTRRPRPPGPQMAPVGAEAGALRFGWVAGGAGSRYRLQVARDAAFTDLVVDQTVETPGTTVGPPAPGTYFLRVKTIETDGYEGEFGTPQSFDVAAPTPPQKRRFPWRRVLLPAVPVVIVILLL